MKHVLSLVATALLALPAHAQAPDTAAPSGRAPVVIQMQAPPDGARPPREIRIVTTTAGEGEPERVITRRILRDAYGEPQAVTIDRIGPGPGRGPGPRGLGMDGGRGLGGAPMLQMMVRRDRSLGLELATVSARLGSYFGAKAGVLVVHSNNAAFKFEDGDVITAIDGRQPTTAQQARRILASYAPGEKIGFKLVRDRKPLSLDVVVPEPPKAVNFELRREGGGHEGAHGGPQGGVAPAPKAP